MTERLTSILAVGPKSFAEAMTLRDAWFHCATAAMESHGAHELHRNLAWLHEIERHLPMIQWWMRQEVKRLERECPAVLIDLEPPVVSQ